MHAERRFASYELNARTSFKAAALAEFRADWATATRMYATAYGEVQKVALGTQGPLQRFFEIAACAEEFHVKVSRCPTALCCLLSAQRNQKLLVASCWSSGLPTLRGLRCCKHCFLLCCRRVLLTALTTSIGS